ncbi:MAG: hypothetical protein Q9192_009098, partial [Flavoplaca navasiana]
QPQCPDIENFSPRHSPLPILLIRIRIPLRIDDTPCTPQHAHGGAEERKFETGDKEGGEELGLVLFVKHDG